MIYLEDPRQALPARDNPQSQNWFEAAPGQDPLAVADGLGRPVAILRLGGRLPNQGETPEATFFYGSPPFVALPAESATTKRTPRQPAEVLPLPPAQPASGRPAPSGGQDAEGPGS